MSTFLTADDLGEVFKETFDARVKWNNILLELGVSVASIESIEKKRRDNPDDCYRDGLHTWLKLGEKSWKDLIKALSSPTVGHKDIATEIEKKFLQSQEGLPTKTTLSRSSSCSDLSEDSGAPLDDYSFDDLDIGCKCPCGRKDFQHVFENIPPNCLANRHSSSENFPELNLNSGQDKKKAETLIEWQLTRDTKKVQDEFVSFGLKVRRAIGSLPNNESFLKHILLLRREDAGSSSFEPLYNAVIVGADFINFEILKSLLKQGKEESMDLEAAKKFEAAEAALTTYEDAFREYAQHRVFSLPGGLEKLCPPVQEDGRQELMLKVEEDFRSFPVDRIRHFREVVKGILELKGLTLRVKSVRQGCVEIRFEVIGHLPSADLSLTTEQCKALVDNNVTMVEYGGQVKYCCCELSEDKVYGKVIKQLYQDVVQTDYQEDDFFGDDEIEHTEDCPHRKGVGVNECHLDKCPSCDVQLQSCCLEIHMLKCEGGSESSEGNDCTSEMTSEETQFVSSYSEGVISAHEPSNGVQPMTKEDHSAEMQPITKEDHSSDVQPMTKEDRSSDVQPMTKEDHSSDVQPMTKEDHSAEDLRRALFEAAKYGRTREIRRLLALGVSVDLADENGTTALLLAASNGHTDTVRELLSSGATVDQADECGRTPLYVACESGHTEVVQVLVKAGANLEACSWIFPQFGRTPLLVASESGHTEVVQVLVKAGANLEACYFEWEFLTFDCRTPLYVASKHGHTEVIQVLVKAGAKLEACDEFGLYVASKCGYTKVVQALVKAGAKLIHAKPPHTVKQTQFMALEPMPMSYQTVHCAELEPPPMPAALYHRNILPPLMPHAEAEAQRSQSNPPFNVNLDHETEGTLPETQLHSQPMDPHNDYPPRIVIVFRSPNREQQISSWNSMRPLMFSSLKFATKSIEDSKPETKHHPQPHLPYMDMPPLLSCGAVAIVSCEPPAYQTAVGSSLMKRKPLTRTNTRTQLRAKAQCFQSNDPLFNINSHNKQALHKAEDAPPEPQLHPQPNGVYPPNTVPRLYDVDGANNKASTSLTGTKMIIGMGVCGPKVLSPQTSDMKSFGKSIPETEHSQKQFPLQAFPPECAVREYTYSPEAAGTVLEVLDERSAHRVPVRPSQPTVRIASQLVQQDNRDLSNYGKSLAVKDCCAEHETLDQLADHVGIDKDLLNHPCSDEHLTRMVELRTDCQILQVDEEMKKGVIATPSLDETNTTPVNDRERTMQFSPDVKFKSSL